MPGYAPNSLLQKLRIFQSSTNDVLMPLLPLRSSTQAPARRRHRWNELHRFPFCCWTITSGASFHAISFHHLSAPTTAFAIWWDFFCLLATSNFVTAQVAKKNHTQGNAEAPHLLHKCTPGSWRAQFINAPSPLDCSVYYPIKGSRPPGCRRSPRCDLEAFLFINQNLRFLRAPQTDASNIKCKIFPPHRIKAVSAK